jgi:hypothetical protein
MLPAALNCRYRDAPLKVIRELDPMKGPSSFEWQATDGLFADNGVLRSRLKPAVLGAFCFS